MPERFFFFFPADVQISGRMTESRKVSRFTNFPASSRLKFRAVGSGARLRRPTISFFDLSLPNHTLCRLTRSFWETTKNNYSICCPSISCIICWVQRLCNIVPTRRVAHFYVDIGSEIDVDIGWYPHLHPLLLLKSSFLGQASLSRQWIKKAKKQINSKPLLMDREKDFRC